MRRCSRRSLTRWTRGNIVHVTGKGANRTDLTVKLFRLNDPSKETPIFENCVADVNIPVGEVFTSPVLEGTTGVLHVSRVFLEGLEYRDLELRFADGMITDYSCGNFEDPEDGKKYVADNVLKGHRSLPLGESPSARIRRRMWREDGTALKTRCPS